MATSAVAAPAAARGSRAAQGAPATSAEARPHAALFAQSYLTSDEPLWFTLADCAASTLITGRAPEILRAIRLVPGPPQHGLATIDIAGNPDYRLDSHSDDFYRRLVDLRASVKTRAKAAKHAGDHELARLDAEQLVLKLIANATSYGCFIELNPTDLEELVKVTAYGLDGEPFATQVQRHEKPGASFHLLLATLITGAARLMLVSAERLALDAGLDWAFMDTDSIALTRPDDITSEDFRQRVAGIRGWSEVLNSYDTKGSLLELEDINRGLGADGTLTDDLEPLYCFVVSPKRYVLFNLEHGQPVLPKASAHGLGHLLAPTTARTHPAGSHNRPWR